MYKKLDEGKIDKKQLNEKMKRAGRILIVSNLDVEECEIFGLFKKRETVEKMFDTYKTVLDADKLYLQSDESVFGHVRMCKNSKFCKIGSLFLDLKA